MITGVLAALVAGFYLLIQYVQLQKQLGRAAEWLAGYRSSTVTLSSGEMTYVDRALRQLR